MGPRSLARHRCIEQLKFRGQQSFQLCLPLAIGVHPVHAITDSMVEFFNCAVILCVQDFLFDKLPQSLNQVQVWRIRWQKNQVNPQFRFSRHMPCLANGHAQAVQEFSHPAGAKANPR